VYQRVPELPFVPELYLRCAGMKERITEKLGGEVELDFEEQSSIQATRADVSLIRWPRPSFLSIRTLI
jgi:hypothetical protein